MQVQVTKNVGEGFRYHLHAKDGKRYHSSDPIYADSWEASTAGHNDHYTRTRGKDHD